MMTFLVPLGIVLASILPSSVCYPAGVPFDTTYGLCQSMTPVHDANPMTSSPPYKVMVSQNCFSDKAEVEVVVEGTQKINGVFVQARPSSGAVNAMHTGTFSEQEPRLKTVSCDGRQNSAISHKGEVDANRTSFRWKPDANSERNITFLATVVYTKAKFWVKIPSSPVIKDDDCVAMFISDTGTSLYQNTARMLMVSLVPLLLALLL